MREPGLECAVLTKERQRCPLGWCPQLCDSMRPFQAFSAAWPLQLHVRLGCFLFLENILPQRLSLIAVA